MSIENAWHRADVSVGIHAAGLTRGGAGRRHCQSNSGGQRSLKSSLTERHDYGAGIERNACVIVTMRGLDDVLSGFVDGVSEIPSAVLWNASVSVRLSGDYRYRGPRAAPEGYLTGAPVRGSPFRPEFACHRYLLVAFFTSSL